MKKSKVRTFDVWGMIHFRGGERDPHNEQWEIRARTKAGAIRKARLRLLSMVKFDAHVIQEKRGKK